MVDENRPISVITPALKEDVPCKVTVKTPKNQVSELPTFRTTDGYGTYFVPAEAGQHALKVECAGQEVPGSPFTVVVEKKSSMFRGLESRKLLIYSNVVLQLFSIIAMATFS